MGGRDSARMLHKNNLSESEATGSIWRAAALCGGRRCSEESFPCQLSTHLTIYLSAGEDDGATLSPVGPWLDHTDTQLVIRTRDKGSTDCNRWMEL